MKMSKADYEDLLASIKGTLADCIPGTVDDLYLEYKENPDIIDHAKAFRWKLFQTSMRWRTYQGMELYDFRAYTDEHIDTALRAIMKELELPQ